MIKWPGRFEKVGKVGRNECHILNRVMAQREKTQFQPLRARSQLSASKSEGSGHHGIRNWKQEPGWGSLEMLLAAASMSQVVFLQLHGLKVQGAGGKQC